MPLPVLDIRSELFPEMSPAMRDVRQDVTSPGLVPWAFLGARAGVIQPVRVSSSAQSVDPGSRNRRPHEGVPL
jgi:hypothetical protein